jgi:DNA-binding NarL/FixJ family response regulator
MQSLSVVIAQKEPSTSQLLAQALMRSVRNVAIVNSRAELQDALRSNHPQAAIVDLELVNGAQLRQLCHEFGRVAVVATHRSPDEEMWMECMEEGAADCCHNKDAEGVLRAIAQNVRLAHAAKAA